MGEFEGVDEVVLIVKQLRKYIGECRARKVGLVLGQGELSALLTDHERLTKMLEELLFTMSGVMQITDNIFSRSKIFASAIRCDQIAQGLEVDQHD